MPDIIPNIKGYENAGAFNELVNSFSGNTKPIAFVGAGNSRCVGHDDYITWIKDDALPLLKLNPEELEQYLNRLHGKFPQSTIEEILSTLNNFSPLAAETFYRLTEKRYLDMGLRHPIPSFAKIPFSGYLTTNYEMVLERQLRENNPKKFSGFSSLNVCGQNGGHYAMKFIESIFGATRTHTNVLHLHGLISEPVTQWAIAPSEVSELYKAFTPQATLLSAICISKIPLVFIGYSLNDEPVYKLFKHHKKLFGSRPTECFHFILLPAYKVDQIQRCTDAGVRPIFYFSGNDENISYKSMIDFLANSVVPSELTLIQNDKSDDFFLPDETT